MRFVLQSGDTVVDGRDPDLWNVSFVPLRLTTEGGVLYFLVPGIMKPPCMDLVVSGGGGAPIYAYTREPDLRDYLKANESSKVTLEHLVKPSVERGSNPYHYVIVHVDGEKLDMEVIGVDWGSGFQPYRSNKIELRDPPQ
ncbi:MAG: hypothetical protein WBC04_18090 [Candidatus Acidiferrales bacterium]